MIATAQHVDDRVDLDRGHAGPGIEAAVGPHRRPAAHAQDEDFIYAFEIFGQLEVDGRLPGIKNDSGQFADAFEVDPRTQADIRVLDTRTVGVEAFHIDRPWIPRFGIRYLMGIDGLALDHHDTLHAAPPQVVGDRRPDATRPDDDDGRRLHVRAHLSLR